MTRSIFDPGNPNVERSGDTFTGPDARQISMMPGSAIDGVVDRKGDPDATPAADSVGFDAAGEPLATPAAPAATAAGPFDADDVDDADGGMDEVQDAHAVGIEKRRAAEA